MCQEKLSSFGASEGATHLRMHQQQAETAKVPKADARLAFVADDAAHAVTMLSEAVKQLTVQCATGWEHPLGIYYKPQGAALDGTVVALFPGQGAQYVNMGRDIANDYPPMRQVIEGMDAAARAAGVAPLSASIFPTPVFSQEEADRQMGELTRTSRAQPAIGALSAGYYKILQGMGLRADFMAGHSYGEVTALWAAGVFSDADFYRVSLARGAAIETPSGNAELGAMVAASLTPERAKELLGQFPDVTVANYNSPEQLVFGGPTASVHALNTALTAGKVRSQLLPVSAAFHTPLVRHACAPFKTSLSKVSLAAPKAAVFSSATGQRHSNSPAAIANALVEQLISPVQFAQTIARIYEQGGRVFVEIGPKGILGKLVADILKGKPHTVVSLNPSGNGDDARQFKRAIAKLVVEGMELNSLDPQLAPLPPAALKKKSLTFTMRGGFFLSAKAKQKREKALRVDTAVVDAFVGARRAAPPPAEIKVNQVVVAADPVAKVKEVVPAANPVAGVTAAAKDETPPQRSAVVRSMHETGMAGVGPVLAATGEGMMQNVSPENQVMSILDAQIHAQNVLSQVHQQFQLNQKDYIQFLNTLVSKQHALLEKFHDSNQLTEVVGSLSQSLQLLDKNQEMYHINHEHYFDNQQIMLGTSGLRGGHVNPGIAQRASVQIAPRPAAPAVERPQVSPALSVPQAVAPAVQPAPAAPAPVAAVQAPKPTLQDVPVANAAPAAKPAAPAPAPAPAPVAAPVAAAVVLSAEDRATVARFEALTRADLVNQLIAIVSDRTGYPANMIDENMDLESDLGIDSIKRLEILGAMFDALATSVPQFQNAEEHKEMETFDIDAFSSILKMAIFFEETIAELLAKLKNGGEAPAAEAPAAAPVAVANNDAVAINETPHAEAAPLRKLGFVATTRKLEDNTQELESKKLSAEPRENASAPVQRVLVSDADTKSETVHRFQALKTHLPKPDRMALQLPPGQIWLLTDDGMGLSDEVARLLLAQGQAVARLLPGWQPGRSARKAIAGVSEHLLEHADEAALQALLADITATRGAVGGFIHLSAASNNLAALDCAFSAAEYDTAWTVFTLAKLLQPTFGDSEGGRHYFFTVSQFDGELGTAQQQSFPVVASGLSGLTKSLNIEWPGVFCRSVDIAPNCTRALAAEMVLEELGDSRTDLAEVGRGAHGERIGLSIRQAAASVPKLDTTIDAGSVFVVTGGGRGITADCVIAMAKRYPARFALLGRTPIDAGLPEWAEDGGESGILKTRAIAYLQAHGEQPTPVKVERMLKQVLHVAEVKQTIAQIAQAGGQAQYFACDITDGADVARVIAEVERRLGPVSGLIHGAGNLADKRIEKKTTADYRAVFDTKVKGLENLVAALRLDGLRHMVLFSSVSGFFGNAGQTDYAMANEVLNKFAHLFQSMYPDRFVRSINWGPWDSGMVNDVLKRAYAERKLEIIPSAVGTACFVNEFGRDGGVQLIVGGGVYKVARKIKALPAVSRTERQLAPASNGFLQDHVVGAHAVLPATAALGWMVQLCEDLLPGYRMEKVSDFRVLKGVVFDGAEQGRFVAEARVVPTAERGGDRHTLDVSIFNESNSITLHRYQARVTMSLAEAAPAPTVALPAGIGAPRTTPAIYGDMGSGALLFHGPAFRGIEAVLQSDRRMLVAAGALPASGAAKQGQFAVNSFNPFVGDVFVQTPLLWLMLQSDVAGLPSQIGQWEQFAALDFGQPFQLSMTLVSHSRAALVVDVIAHDDTGKVFSKLSGLVFTVSKKMRQLLCDPETAITA